MLYNFYSAGKKLKSVQSMGAYLQQLIIWGTVQEALRLRQVRPHRVLETGHQCVSVLPLRLLLLPKIRSTSEEYLQHIRFRRRRSPLPRWVRQSRSRRSTKEKSIKERKPVSESKYKDVCVFKGTFIRAITSLIPCNEQLCKNETIRAICIKSKKSGR